MERIKYKTANLDIDLELRGPVVVVQGNTSTGKSYVFETLRRMKKTDNLYFISYDLSAGDKNIDYLVKFITESDGLCIILDQADELLEAYEKLLIAICKDVKNQYVLIGRNPEVMTSPDCIAELKIENKKATLKYLIENSI